MSVPQRSFIRAIKSKIIIALLLACLALVLAWGVSKVVFNEMLNTVQDISGPSDRLRLVNKISNRIASLDQQQKKLAFNKPGNYTQLFRESGHLRKVLDTLSALYSDDSTQLARIKSISTLLSQRDKQFIDYLKVRERLVNNRSFSTEVRKLNTLVSKNAERPDSTIVTTEQRTSTTTIYPNEEKPKGFLNRLFGRKGTEDNQALKVVSQENVRRDTISVSKEPAEVAKSLEVSLKAIEQEQRKKSASFLDREAALANANALIVSQMLDILRKVESEVVHQIDLSGVKAQQVVNRGIKTIDLIMLVFFLVTALLLYLILTDITRSNRYRRQLELAKDEAEYHSIAKQRFLSNMSHEIRSPLQSIIGYAEVLKQHPQPRQKDIDAIAQSSEHLLQIVNEVLDYNRLTSGKFSFSKKPFHIRQLLDEVLSAMQLQAEKKSLVLRGDFDLEPLSHIIGDPFRLKQILYNLIGNAIKFTHVGEVVLSVFYKRQGAQLHFTFVVKDTGIGISEADCKTIFNEFEQADSPARDALNQTGAGLGLNIVKALVDNQGGRIYVTSKEGLGSSFTVYLTFEITEDEPVQASPAVAFPASGVSNTKVWMIDDDHLILDLCALILDKNKIEYRRFYSPSEMLNAEWEPDVTHLLVDIRMSELNGIELCKIFRQRVGHSIKIFAMTAQVLEPDQPLYEGFDGIIHKPFKERDLMSVLTGFDTSTLQKMTYGDVDQLNKILKRFVEDCEVDIGLVKRSLQLSDSEQLTLIMHRLAGRIAQIGSKSLAADFRLAEIGLDQDGLTMTRMEQITMLTDRLQALLVAVRLNQHQPSIS